MLPETPIQDSSSTASHKFNFVQQQSTIRWKWYKRDHAWASPEDMSKLYDSMIQTPASLPLLPHITLMALWGVPYGQLAEEYKLNPGLQMLLLHDM